MIAKTLMRQPKPRVSGKAELAVEECSPLRIVSDGELLRQCLKGNQGAWRQLIDRYGRLVCATARQCGLNVADSEDVMQIVFTRLFRAMRSLRDHQRLAPWLITTARRECWRMSQRNRGAGAAWGESRSWPIDSHHDAAAGSHDEQAMMLEQQHLIRQALMQLPARDQRLLKALFLDNRNESYEQIAMRLDMRPGSIGPTRARAFKRLEKILIEMGLGPNGSNERPAEQAHGSTQQDAA